MSEQQNSEPMHISYVEAYLRAHLETAFVRVIANLRSYGATDEQIRQVLPTTIDVLTKNYLSVPKSDESQQR